MYQRGRQRIKDYSHFHKYVPIRAYPEIAIGIGIEPSIVDTDSDFDPDFDPDFDAGQLLCRAGQF